MDAFLSTHQGVMRRVISGVDRYDHGLKSLSVWWEKIALIGKINSFEVASTILQDMDNTLGQFNELQVRLIESLINEHTRKVLIQNASRSQMAIDVLIRNLFERTADIGFLSTDYDVVQYLKKDHINEGDRDYIEQRLRAYINIYSVYNDAILLKPDGELVFQISQPTRTGIIKDTIIHQAINNPNDYVEYFGKSELINDSTSNLLYANAVVENDIVVGVIILCFRFNNELESIVERLLSKGEKNHFLLLNGAGDIIFAPQYADSPVSSQLALTNAPELVTINSQNMVKICAKGQPYQGYAGPDNWHMGSLFPVDDIEGESRLPDGDHEYDQGFLKDLSGLISDDLFDIRRQSITINDDLQLIVLNGIITAARKDAVEFMPVLEAIKKIGKDIDNVFEDSIESLFSTIISGQLNAIRLQANLAVDIMDRNLFERANDCRWWGLSSLLQSSLMAPEVDVDEIKHTLSKIHSLYTVYHTLYVFDKNGHYVAFSNDEHANKIGQKIEANSGGQHVFQLQDIYQYSVSPFGTFDCYNGENTYVYNAAIRDAEDLNTVIGGIGIVFDSTTEFKAILNEILPHENGQVKAGARALFTTEEGLVLASSSEDHAIGSMFFPDINRNELQNEGNTATAIKLKDRVYLIGAAKSNGYREYKTQDGYDNTVIAWVLIPC